MFERKWSRVDVKMDCNTWTGDDHAELDLGVEVAAVERGRHFESRSCRSRSYRSRSCRRGQGDDI